ncbi:xanthine dehydrogenase accessory protein XdhC [Planktotalea sp.]|uniref:xanthine dehydrogenase accessory protein XdhC n=1 Tax=Planktotalea sp. TaxID=2029877 RepID=UPI0025EBF406|nr:xanthine dehydrogenase accessory protein XdhC [Planktotalea sp.]
MGFDLDALRCAIERHGHVARVVIADVKGSSPREVGASMLVWAGGQSGTIGGGALEFELSKRALGVQEKALTRHALGPQLGQCCGGALQIVTEVFDAVNLPQTEDDIVARCVVGTKGTPLKVKRILADARSQGITPHAQLCEGWFIEPIARPTRPLWIWGAGHVGRAIVSTLAPLPEFAITWIDTSDARFPESSSENVTKLSAANPALLARHAPLNAEHLILTYSHALDLKLCHQLLIHSFAFTGLIGSKSKWARFRNRLAALGHTNEQILRITCPIGDPHLGKHPQAIAISVASRLLMNAKSLAQTQRTTA